MKTELKDSVNSFYAKSTKDWRRWLEKNGRSEKSVWLIIYKKDSGVASVTYKEAVEEALCFGWIDSKPNKRDEKSYYQFFARRNPKSKWSKVNKKKVEQLIAEGRMDEMGMEAIAVARQNGTWEALDDVDDSVVPADLQEALEKDQLALANFERFPKSSKKIILEWIVNAKKEETRRNRIHETVTLAAKNIRANHYRDKA